MIIINYFLIIGNKAGTGFLQQIKFYTWLSVQSYIVLQRNEKQTQLARKLFELLD